jgi:hypothetical protein
MQALIFATPLSIMESKKILSAIFRVSFSTLWIPR